VYLLALQCVNALIRLIGATSSKNGRVITPTVSAYFGYFRHNRCGTCASATSHTSGDKNKVSIL